jgi:hypothetical protein
MAHAPLGHADAMQIILFCMAYFLAVKLFRYYWTSGAPEARRSKILHCKNNKLLWAILFCWTKCWTFCLPSFDRGNGFIIPFIHRQERR